MCLQVCYKKFFFASLKSLKQGFGSESISQRYGSADPDPHQHVTNPQHWPWAWVSLTIVSTDNKNTRSNMQKIHLIQIFSPPIPTTSKFEYFVSLIIWPFVIVHISPYCSSWSNYTLIIMFIHIIIIVNLFVCCFCRKINISLFEFPTISRY
jgi:hypothetical protein